MNPKLVFAGSRDLHIGICRSSSGNYVFLSPYAEPKRGQFVLLMCRENAKWVINQIANADFSCPFEDVRTKPFDGDVLIQGCTFKNIRLIVFRTVHCKDMVSMKAELQEWAQEQIKAAVDSM